MNSTLTAVQLSTPRRRTFLWSWLIWTAGFLAFPIAGVAGRAVAGRVDSPTAALVAGLVTGGILPVRSVPAGTARVDAAVVGNR